MDLVQYDLTWTLIQHLDPHQILPLLDFLDGAGLYRSKDLLVAKLEMVSRTRMVDYAGELYANIHGENEEKKKEYESKTLSVHAELEELTKKCQPLLAMLQEDKTSQKMIDKGTFTMEKLIERYSVRKHNLPNLYLFAKLAFDCGMYEEAANVLFFFRELSSHGDDNERKFQALWGKLAAEILLADPSRAYEDLTSLKDSIDNRNWENQMEILVQRTWLIHWSLFVFVNLRGKGISLMVSFLTGERMLNTIQTNCPHILRYLSLCIVFSNSQKDNVERVVAVIQQERETYSDPLTEFLAAVYIEYDFRKAQETLKEIEKVWSIDFFLGYYKYDRFINCARVLMFETFCKVHSQISISDMNQVMELSGSEDMGERRILELLQETHSSGKIDTSKNQIIMTHSHTNIYQQIIGKTKNLSDRTTQLMEQVEKRYQQRAEGKD